MQPAQRTRHPNELHARPTFHSRSIDDSLHTHLVKQTQYQKLPREREKRPKRKQDSLARPARKRLQAKKPPQTRLKFLHPFFFYTRNILVLKRPRSPQPRIAASHSFCLKIEKLHFQKNKDQSCLINNEKTPNG